MAIDKENHLAPVGVPSPELVSGISFKEPTMGREDVYSPYEAPSLLARFMNPEVDKHQEDVENMIRLLVRIGLPVDAPDSLRALILQHFFSRDVVLDTENREGYDHRLVLLPEFELTGEPLARHDRVMTGIGRVAEIDQHRADVRSMAAQLAMLRTVGVHRTEYEAPMFEEVDALLGDNLEVSPPKKLQIFEYDANFYQERAINGLIMGFKRDRGERPDGTLIKSRHTFVVRTDYAGGMDPKIREAIQKSAELGINRPMRLKRVRELIAEIARVGATHELVAASMTSAYVFDPNVKDLIVARDIAADKKRKSEGKAGLDLFEQYFQDRQNLAPRITSTDTEA
jgi:hypothetical protein